MVGRVVSSQDAVMSAVQDLALPETVLNTIPCLPFHLLNQPLDALKVSISSSLAYFDIFSFSMPLLISSPSSLTLVNHLYSALSTTSWLPARCFCWLRLSPPLNAFMILSLFFSHIESVFGGTLYCGATSFLPIALSSFFKVSYLSSNVL